MQLKRSERAQPSGRPSRLENIPDMITTRLGWLEKRLLHPYGCLAVGWWGGKGSPGVSRYVSQPALPSFWPKTTRKRSLFALAHNKTSLRILLLHSTIDGIDSEWVISVAACSFTRAHTHYPATRQSTSWFAIENSLCRKQDFVLCCIFVQIFCCSCFKKCNFVMVRQEHLGLGVSVRGMCRICRTSKDATDAVQYCSICRTKSPKVWFINNWLKIQSSMKSNKTLKQLFYQTRTSTNTDTV